MRAPEAQAACDHNSDQGQLGEYATGNVAGNDRVPVHDSQPGSVCQLERVHVVMPHAIPCHGTPAAADTFDVLKTADVISTQSCCMPWDPCSSRHI